MSFPFSFRAPFPFYFLLLLRFPTESILQICTSMICHFIRYAVLVFYVFSASLSFYVLCGFYFCFLNFMFFISDMFCGSSKFFRRIVPPRTAAHPFSSPSMSTNVLLMWSRGSLTAAIWRSPNDRQGVKHISFVIWRFRGHASNYSLVTNGFNNVIISSSNFGSNISTSAQGPL